MKFIIDNVSEIIRKGADDYEAKRVCEAERKRKERKARAKGSSSESSVSEMTQGEVCSVKGL